MYVFTQPLIASRISHKVNFYAEFNRFDFRLFLLLEWLATKGKEPRQPYYFTHTWR